MSNKIGFWAVFALVTGSQIGSSVFMLPANLAGYGVFSLVGLAISGIGAITLCLVFASLCAKFPETGGPHTYIKHTFGLTAAFFTGWTYWVISWVSTTAVIVTAIGSLSVFIGPRSPFVYLALEIILLLLITLLNLRGVKAAGKAELFLTLLKFIPLLIMPLIALCFFDSNNFIIDQSVSSMSNTSILAKVTLLTLWGFIGLESATTPAGSVENPSKTIPKAIISGTLCVALLYFVNSIGIMGLISGQDLMHSKAPYVDAAQIIFGGQWYLAIACIAAIICVGTLNAWILASGQIALGLAEDGLMPQIFAQKNKHNAPFWGIIASCAGIIPLLFLTANESLVQQMNAIIDFSVMTFLFVYLMCCLAFLKLLIQKKLQCSIIEWIFGLVASGFCVWIMYETPIKTLAIASLFVLSGLPLYLFWYIRTKQQPLLDRTSTEF